MTRPNPLLRETSKIPPWTQKFKVPKTPKEIKKIYNRDVCNVTHHLNGSAFVYICLYFRQSLDLTETTYSYLDTFT